MLIVLVLASFTSDFCISLALHALHLICSLFYASLEGFSCGQAQNSPSPLPSPSLPSPSLPRGVEAITHFPIIFPCATLSVLFWNVFVSCGLDNGLNNGRVTVCTQFFSETVTVPCFSCGVWFFLSCGKGCPVDMIDIDKSNSTICSSVEKIALFWYKGVLHDT